MVSAPTSTSSLSLRSLAKEVAALCGSILTVSWMSLSAPVDSFLGFQRKAYWQCCLSPCTSSVDSRLSTLRESSLWLYEEWKGRSYVWWRLYAWYCDIILSFLPFQDQMVNSDLIIWESCLIFLWVKSIQLVRVLLSISRSHQLIGKITRTIFEAKLDHKLMKMQSVWKLLWGWFCTSVLKYNNTLARGSVHWCSSMQGNQVYMNHKEKCFHNAQLRANYFKALKSWGVWILMAATVPIIYKLTCIGTPQRSVTFHNDPFIDTLSEFGIEKKSSVGNYWNGASHHKL